MNDLGQSIIAANQRIKAVEDVEDVVKETPLLASVEFSQRTGADFLLKCEHRQRTGSFKMRGAMNKVLCLNADERSQGIITASSGNHGMATAEAARIVGVDVTIYLPDTVSEQKIDTMKAFGATTTLVAGNAVAAEQAARVAAEQQRKTYVSPYADPDIIAGQGTVGLELADQCTALAAVYVCVGGGGLIAGVGGYLKDKCPEADIIGCWPQNAPAMHCCLEKGEIYDVHETDTLSDGSAGGVEPGAITFTICQQVIDRHLLVSEAEIADAMRDMATHENDTIEGAAGVALAAALKDAGRYRGVALP